MKYWTLEDGSVILRVMLTWQVSTAVETPRGVPVACKGYQWTAARNPKDDPLLPQDKINKHSSERLLREVLSQSKSAGVFRKYYLSFKRDN
jgi:hypothetical protein